jgi:hypothetical protein
MRLYIFYNKEYEPMKRKFVSSLKDDYEVIAINVDYDRELSFGGGRSTWVTKTKLILKSIKENMGHFLIFSDIDIVFFKKTELIVSAALRDADIVFQREYEKSGVNIGFIAMRCKKDTLRFWGHVLSEIQRTDCWDQLVVNKMLYLDQYQISWKRFPPQIFNSTQGGLEGLKTIKHFFWRLFKIVSTRREVNMPAEYCDGKVQTQSRLSPQHLLTKDICLYHANFSGHDKNAMQLKLDHLELIGKYIKMPGIELMTSLVYSMLIRIQK